MWGQSGKLIGFRLPRITTTITNNCNMPNRNHDNSFVVEPSKERKKSKENILTTTYHTLRYLSFFFPSLSPCLPCFPFPPPLCTALCRTILIETPFPHEDEYLKPVDPLPVERLGLHFFLKENHNSFFVLPSAANSLPVSGWGRDNKEIETSEKEN
jgi:hypothetical protein